MFLSGVDAIRSVLANNLPASYFPTFSPSDPDADGYSVQVLPSLQVQLQTARHFTVPGQLRVVNNSCSGFLQLMPGQLRLACASSTCHVEYAAHDQSLPTAELSAGMHMLLIPQ